MSIKFLVLGGGGILGFLGGEGSADFIFMGAGTFLNDEGQQDRVSEQKIFLRDLVGSGVKATGLRPLPS